MAQQLLRFRDRARLSAHQNPVLSIEGVNVPGQQPPSTPVAVPIFLSNSAQFIGPGDPNRCDPQGFLSAEVGLEVEVRLEIGGVFQDSDIVCVPGSEAPFGGVGTAETTLETTTPAEPGTFSFDVVAETARTGDLVGRATQSIQVTEAAQPAEPPDNGGNGNGNEPDNGGLFEGPILPCFLDPNRACETPETVLYGAAGALLLVALAG